MSDIVAQLRRDLMEISYDDIEAMAREATDEIERLRAQLKIALAALDSANDEVHELRAEVERLRAALEAYACPGLGNCREPKLDDGSCLMEATGGRCGDEAYCALRALEPKP